MKTDLFQSCGLCWVLQIYWPIECSTLTAWSFRIWNSSAGITSPLLVLFLGGSVGKAVACQCKRHGFNPWVRKIPWRRKWQPTLVFLPVKSRGQRSLAGYSPVGITKSRTWLGDWTTTMLKVLWTSHSRMSGSRWVTAPTCSSRSLRLFCTVLCILATSS